MIFNKTIILLALVGYEMIIASLAIYRLIYNARSGNNCKIFPSFSWGIFAHVTSLDQSRTSENI